MEAFSEIIVRHAPHAHWYIFGAIILAGANVPISADLLIILSALLAANVIPEHTWHLFLSVWLGCLISAWVAYWIGRIIGPKLSKWRWFSRLLSASRLEKIRLFYDKHGLWTLIAGRFIPFGIRNAIFMTTGISKLSFRKFALRDCIACSIWSSICFYIFYTLGQNYEVLSHYVKTFNILIFAAFSVTVIGIFWYKKRKSSKSTTIREAP